MTYPTIYEARYAERVSTKLPDILFYGRCPKCGSLPMQGKLMDDSDGLYYASCPPQVDVKCNRCGHEDRRYVGG